MTFTITTPSLMTISIMAPSIRLVNAMLRIMTPDAYAECLYAKAATTLSLTSLSTMTFIIVTVSINHTEHNQHASA